MRKFFERDEETGMISFPETPLFPNHVEGRAEQIMKALDGLKVCSALRLLDLCKDAVMQCPVNGD